MRGLCVFAVILLGCSKSPTPAATPDDPPPATRVPDEATELGPPAAENECPEGQIPFELDHHDGAVACLDAESSSAAKIPESGPYRGDYFDGADQASMANTPFTESPKVSPKVAGCADGQRELFADITAHPKIAGCLGSWSGDHSLRTAPSGAACGDDLPGDCAVPADVCAPGWHVCGRDGRAQDLTARVSENACNTAGPGRFNAGMSHSSSEEINPCPAVDGAPLPCSAAGLGSESVCCGDDCRFAKCKDFVWPGGTKVSRGTAEGCGGVTSTSNPGVLCCSDR